MHINPYESPRIRGEQSSPLATKGMFNWFSIAAMLSLLLYVFALISEAAGICGGIGFNEPLTWPLFIKALGAVGVDDVVRLRTLLCAVVSVPGMLFFVGFPIATRQRVPTKMLAIYLAILLAIGGGLGILLLAFVPFVTLDGEFLVDGAVRYVACGIWTSVVILCLILRRQNKRGRTDVSAISDYEP